MIKGARKQMIVIRTGDSRYFDEAYFVLRGDAGHKTAHDTDILHEANRILSENRPNGTHGLQGRWLKWLFFGIGCLCGAALAVLIGLLLL